DTRGFAHINDALHPGQERMLRPPLGFHVDSLIAVDGIGNQGRVQAFRIGPREASVPATIPLHRSAYTISIAEVNIVPHSDFVAVVDDRSAWHGHQQSV